MTDNHHTNYVTTLTEERVREIVREEVDAILSARFDMAVTPNTVREWQSNVAGAPRAPGGYLVGYQTAEIFKPGAIEGGPQPVSKSARGGRRHAG